MNTGGIYMTIRFYTLDDLQTMFGLGERTLLRYLSDGRLQGFKAGREWRFTDEDIAAFVERLRSDTKMHPAPHVTIMERKD